MRERWPPHYIRWIAACFCELHFGELFSCEYYSVNSIRWNACYTETLRQACARARFGILLAATALEARNKAKKNYHT